MHIRFGMHLDGEHSWQRHNALGDVTVGPLGLLGILEVQLGLTASHPSRAARVIQYRDCVKRTDSGMRFYSASFATDEIGTASTLLDWRDALILHGWDGRFVGAGVSARLLDLADVEAAIASAMQAPCIGERLAAVAELLATRRLPVTGCTVIERKSLIPIRWQTVLAYLGATYPPDVDSAPKNNERVPSFLGGLQTALRAPDEENLVTWVDDGSVILLCSDTRLAAAQWVSAYLASHPPTQECPTLVVSNDAGALLDDTLAASAGARAGLDAMSALRPALQLLPLALALMWEPLNVSALLAFLSLSVAPIHPAHRRKLAVAVAESPGISGPAWKAALADIERGCDDFDKVHDAIVSWTQPVTFAVGAPATLSVLLARVIEVRQYFHRQLVGGVVERHEVFHAGFAQCAAFEAALQEMVRQGESTISLNQIDLLLQQATSQGAANPQRYREVGCVLTATNPAAVIGPVDTVIWFWATPPRMPERSHWTSAERSTLTAAGVHLPDPAVELAWQARTWLQPLLSASHRMILILPADEAQVHPVWHTIRAAIRPTLAAHPSSKHIRVLPVTSIESYIPHAGTDASWRPVAHLPRQAARRWWQLASPVPAHASALSYSALSLLMNDPYQWVLRYPARLSDSRVQAIKDGPTLYGTLAHRLVELLVARWAAGGIDASELDTWFEPHFATLIKEEGAVLLLLGRGAELSRVKRKLQHAIHQVHGIFAVNASESIVAECDLTGSFSGGKLAGSADLLLSGPGNQSAIIDMKWGSAAIHRASLESGSHLQLLLYAYMHFQKAGHWPTVAYFILGSGSLHAAETGYFKNTNGVRKSDSENAPTLWQRFEKGYAWRAAQLQKGLIEVSCAAESTPESVPPEDGMKLVPLNSDWNVYKHLAGWSQS